MSDKLWCESCKMFNCPCLDADAAYARLTGEANPLDTDEQKRYDVLTGRACEIHGDETHRACNRCAMDAISKARAEGYAAGVAAERERCSRDFVCPQCGTGSGRLPEPWLWVSEHKKIVEDAVNDERARQAAECEQPGRFWTDAAHEADRTAHALAALEPLREAIERMSNSDTITLGVVVTVQRVLWACERLARGE